MVIADVLSRYNQLKTNQPSFMITGTDEHGIKIERAAMKNQQTPAELCDSVSIRFRVCKKSTSLKIVCLVFEN
jgi:methionyl-tRNA synthetase